MPAKCEHIKLVCSVCGAEFYVPPYRKAKAMYCAVPCRQKGTATKSARKRGDMQRGRGEGKTYIKYRGKHLHRRLAEQKLGRALIRGEVVHHINGDKRDNRIENIEVLPSQSIHAKIHHISGGGRWTSR